jgi:gliding motility-associated-like protein
VDYNFEVSPKKASPFAPVRFSAEVLPGQEVYWFYGSGESSAAEFEHTFDQNGKYPVYFRFIDENGCTYYDTTEVTVKYFSLFVPTSFTPDGNGLNDVFQPEGFGIAHYHLTVYNRWGEVVFDRANAPWDGAMEGEPQPSGVYVYQLEVTDDFGEVSQRQGTMTLFR